MGFKAIMAPVNEVLDQAYAPFIKIQSDRGLRIGLRLVGFGTIDFIEKGTGVHFCEWQNLISEELTMKQAEFLDQDDDGQPGGSILCEGNSRAISYFIWNA